MARKNNRRAAAEAPAAEVEAIDKPGMGIDEGIVLFTFFILACALTCVIMAGQAYN
ncbi:MAG: hypothetical protein ACE37K_03955 [Planctomycetota bacterium]|jgi:hypothetical protein